MAQKPGIPKGTRDFSPLEMAKRNYIFSVIQKQFRLFGFSQIETPAMENLSTLMGKYGEEGDKLLFKILNSGNFLADVEESDLTQATNKVVNKISEKGLRYDLTVPFARYVVQHRSDIAMPFKRFQIQPVWRADRPQKGRYREFYQCDADIVGSDSLLNEVELLNLIDCVFTNLKIRVAVKINNRKILSGISEIIGCPDKIVDITVAIDKLDKIGIDAVNDELRQKGLSESQIEKLEPILNMSGTNESKLDSLKSILADSSEGLKGVEELEFVLTKFNMLGHNNDIEVDISLARGLNYYTGTILEVKALDVQIGSITGGGRYDNLTGVFGLQGLSGVGISFGADRIYDVMSQLNLFPQDMANSSKIMFVNFGDKEADASLKFVNRLHNSGISAQLYPDSAKMKKQMAYANSMNIPFVGIIGEAEMNSDLITLKDMMSGEQQMLDFEALVSRLK